MNERIQTLLAKFKETESTHRGAHVLIGSDEIEKFAELIEQDCIDKFIKVWYEQGLDIRGAEVDKFMLCYEEFDK